VYLLEDVLQMTESFAGVTPNDNHEDDQESIKNRLVSPDKDMLLIVYV
jgi:hypothetical protein